MVHRYHRAVPLLGRVFDHGPGHISRPGCRISINNVIQITTEMIDALRKASSRGKWWYNEREPVPKAEDYVITRGCCKGGVLRYRL